MSGMIERLPGWPTLPDLFGWVESGLPTVHTVPGTHGIRIEERLTDGTYVLRAELPGIDPAEDVEITITEGVLTLRAERTEETKEKHHTEFRYGHVHPFRPAAGRSHGRRGDRGLQGRCPDHHGSGAGGEGGHQDHPRAARLSAVARRSRTACAWPAGHPATDTRLFALSPALLEKRSRGAVSPIEEGRVMTTVVSAQEEGTRT
ncbi:hypothetical protein SAMN04487981_105210 [Streptomyces sp. cf386]|nr:hypothetical protein SAMN04487981_105210 [Streptomyces sp. cf386]